MLQMSLPCKTENREESDDDVMIISGDEKETVHHQVSDVDLSSESVDEEDGNPGNLPETSSGTTIRNGIRRSSRNAAKPKVSYEETSDDDGKTKENEKEEQKKSLETMISLRHFFDFYGSAKLRPKVTNVNLSGSETIDLQDFIRFCDTNQKQIERIRVEALDPQILKEMAKRLIGLQVLGIPESSEDQPSEDLKIPSNLKATFNKNLVKAILVGSNNFLTQKNGLKCLLSSFPKTFEDLSYTFSSLDDVNLLLNTINSFPNITNLKRLTLIAGKIKSTSEDEKELTLHKEQIVLIANLNLPGLRTLELNCGIWEDVRPADLTNLLSKFAFTLFNFTIAGNLQAVDLADKQFKFQVPKMAELVTFNMGSVYDIEADNDGFDDEDEYDDDSDSDSEGHSSSNRRTSGDGIANDVISLDKAGAVSIEISFFPTPTLEVLSLGNLIHVDSISPSMFPQLKTLHIGSDWTTTLRIPTSPDDSTFPVFEYVRQLRLPDFIQDQFFMLNVRKMFPELRKITMKYPSMKCLRYFFHGMAGSALKTLNLKTSCDFEGMLEDALFPKRSPPPIRNDNSLCKLLAFKNMENSVFNEFIRDKGIELPIWTESGIDDDILRKRQHGINDLPHLSKLLLEHLPRTSRIPINNKVSYKDPLQTFYEPHVGLIGFKRYPLSEKFLRRDIAKLKNLEWIRPTREHKNNFHLSRSPKLYKTCKYTGQQGATYRSNDAGNFHASSDEEVIDDYGFLDMSNNNLRQRKQKVKRTYALDRHVKKVKKDEPWDDIKPNIKNEPKLEPKAEIKAES